MTTFLSLMDKRRIPVSGIAAVQAAGRRVNMKDDEPKSVGSAVDAPPCSRFRHARRAVRTISIVLWLASLCLPTAGENHDPQLAPGWFLLLTGPLGFLIGQFAWIGNIGLLWSLVTTRRWPLLITAFSFVAGANWHQIADDVEMKPVTGYGPGYYLWLGAMIVATIPLFFPAEFRSKQRKSL